MKTAKQILLALSILCSSLHSQITLNSSYTQVQGINSYASKFYLSNFNFWGYKYVFDDHVTKSIRIYNLDNSLALNIAIPTVAIVGNVYNVYCVTDNLFNLGNDREYIVENSGNVGSGGNMIPKVYIFDESGSLIFSRDTAVMVNNSNMSNIRDEDPSSTEQMVFFDGQGYKMKIATLTPAFSLNKFEVYDLPGKLPCVQCTTSTSSVGRPKYQGNSSAETIFYPNPVKDQIKLKYSLPKDYKTAEINIQDVQGKLIESFKVTNDFDFIYVPSNYNNGLYLYSLLVDGAVIKTERIVLNKD